VEGLLRAIAERGAASLAPAHEDQEGGMLDPELAGIYEDLILAVHAPAVRAHAFLGGGGEVDQDGQEGPAPFSGQPHCSHLGGFWLHAARWVASHDRQGLEPLLRYGLRPPLAGPRLALTPEGRVLYTLRRPWPKPDGRTQLVLHQLLRRVFFVEALSCPRCSLPGNRSR
jgi:hypothetical protein